MPRSTAGTSPPSPAPLRRRNPPTHYARALFDGYAADFDEHLVGMLGYRAHESLLREGAAHIGARPAIGLALDLGCGTGLCGPLLRASVQRLVGIDISPGMLHKARERGLYDELIAGDVVEQLAPFDGVADLVVAADVLVYLGDLDALFAAVRRSTKPGALFGFTVEPGDPHGPPVQLLPSLRHAHSRGHLDALAERHGFEFASCVEAPLRNDQREPVMGLYVWMKRA